MYIVLVGSENFLLAHIGVSFPFALDPAVRVIEGKLPLHLLTVKKPMF